jgi:hypothetical protein
MKQTRRFFLGLVACAIAFGTSISLMAQARDEVAKVVRVSGTARYTTGGGVWQPLRVGDVLRAGSVVQTDVEKGSYVDVVIGDGSAAAMATPASTTLANATAPSKGGLVRFQPAAQQNAVRVFETTVLGFDKLTAVETGADLVTDTQLDLKAGHILGSVKKLNAASRYEIRLPNGVAGVRGTVYHLWADGRISVANGGMVFSFVDPQGNVQVRDIMGGQTYNPRSDQVLPIPASELSWMQSIVGALAARGLVPTPVTLDRTTYYLQPFVSDTTGDVPTGE